MQTFSPPVQGLLQKPEVAIFFLVKYDSVLFTSLPYDFDIGGLSYKQSPVEGGGASLLSLEPPRMSSTLDKAAYKIILSDPGFVFRDAAMSGKVGAPVEVRFGFFNTNPTSMTDSGNNTIHPGEPLKHIDDTFVIYKGYASSQTYTVDFDGTAKFIIEGTSPFGALDNVKAYYTTKEFISTKFNTSNGDTAYDKIHEGAVETRVKWGKT